MMRSTLTVDSSRAVHTQVDPSEAYPLVSNNTMPTDTTLKALVRKLQARDGDARLDEAASCGGRVGREGGGGIVTGEK